jgi:hypothetical protein
VAPKAATDGREFLEWSLGGGEIRAGRMGYRRMEYPVSKFSLYELTKSLFYQPFVQKVATLEGGSSAAHPEGCFKARCEGVESLRADVAADRCEE